MVMPALPGAYLVLVHPHFTLAAFETGFITGARFDDARQFCERGYRQLPCGYLCWTEVVTIAIASVLIGGLRRALGLQRAGVRARTAGDHQPLVGSHPFAFEPRLHAAGDHLDFHRPFLTIAYRQPPPCMWGECFPPLRHRLPRGLRSPSTPLVHRQRHLQVANRGGAGHSQHIALTTLTQVVAEPRVAAQFIVTRHPTVRDVLPPQVEHLQALVGSRVILHLLRHMAGVTSLLIPGPLLRKVQTEVEQGVIVARDVPHEHTHLAVVDLTPVATPLTLHPH